LGAFPFFLLARRLFGKETALWALFFFLFSPLHLYWSRQIMADIPALFFVLLGVALWFGTERTAKYFWIGVVLGVGCWMKYFLLLFVLIFFFWMALQDEKVSKKSFGIALFFVGLLMGLIPLLLYHVATFGSPFQTGFSFWTPEWLKWHHMFSFSYFFSQPRLPEGGMPNGIALLRFLLGVMSPWHQNAYAFLFVPFIGWGAWKIQRETGPDSEKRKAFLRFVLVSLMVFLIFLFCFFAQNMRYFLLVSPFLILVGAFGFHRVWILLPHRIQQGAFLVLMALVLLSPWTLWKISPTHQNKADYEKAVKQLDEASYFISGWDPASFYHTFQRNSRRRYLALSEHIEYVHLPFQPDPMRKISFFIAEEKWRLLGMMTPTGKVYLDSASCEVYPTACGKIKEKYILREAATSGNVVVYEVNVR